MSGSGKVNRISSKDVSVVFNASGYYATDQLRIDINDNRFTKQYETLPSESGDYKVLYKMVSDAPEKTDIITAKVKLSKGRTTDDIIFKTIQGTKVEVKGWNGNTATLELKREFDFVKTEILATVKPKDSTQNYDIAGKANLWQVKSRKVNLTIVPVGSSVDQKTIDDIKDIYNKVGVDFNITIDEPFKIDQSDWDINGDQKLDIGDSNTLANYTPEQRAIYYHYQQQRAPQQQRYYIFVLGKNIETIEPDTQGFMPLKRQYGFVYNPKNLARTIAHELGHGVFGLEHPFKQYNITQGKTDLLMDYGKGTALTQMDWQKIHAPGVQLYIFQKDEDGEAVADHSEFIKDIMNQIRKASLFQENSVTVHIDKTNFNKGGSAIFTKDIITSKKTDYKLISLSKYNCEKCKITLPILRKNIGKTEYESNNIYFALKEDDAPVEISLNGLRFILEEGKLNDFLDYLNAKDVDPDKNVVLFVEGYTPSIDLIGSMDNIIKQTIRDKKEINNENITDYALDTSLFIALRTTPVIGQIYMIATTSVDVTSNTMDSFRDNIFYSEDREGYWAGIDQKFIGKRYKNKGNVINLYASGNYSASTRMNTEGFNKRKAGGVQAGIDFLNKYGTIYKDHKVDIVAHSMGYAYALGIIETLKKEKYQIDTFYAFAPENPREGYMPENVTSFYKYGSTGKESFWDRDFVAPQARIPKMFEKGGLEIRIPEKELIKWRRSYTYKDERKTISLLTGFNPPVSEVIDNPNYGKETTYTWSTCPLNRHSIINYKWVIDLESKEKGFIKPKQDKK